MKILSLTKSELGRFVYANLEQGGVIPATEVELKDIEKKYKNLFFVMDDTFTDKEKAEIFVDTYGASRPYFSGVEFAEIRNGMLLYKDQNYADTKEDIEEFINILWAYIEENYYVRDNEKEI